MVSSSSASICAQAGPDGRHRGAGLPWDERLRALGLNAFETLNRHPAVEWFRRTVTPQRHPNLHRVMPALAGIDGVQDFRYQLDLFVRGLR
ncbi:hypothetical protein [Amycolatopsis sp. NPDC006125]|uniref:hypothetical protein n=1 Tax=Amycolatopsis sp. NPDC006125 TaxID=3156730 RepID=UPI0033ACBDFF